MLIPEWAKTGDKVELCRNCIGSGTRHRLVLTDNDTAYKAVDKVTCPKCGGCGMIRAEEGVN